jgi:hypothetical protein
MSAADDLKLSSNRTFIRATIAIVLLAAIGGGIIWSRLLNKIGEERNNEDVEKLQTPETNAPAWFRDVTAESGINFIYRNGEEANQFTILETLGGGVALFDYDRDGLLDIFVTGGGYFAGPNKTEIMGSPCKLYRNLGNWKFQDVTQEVGLDRPWWYTHGAAVADYDRDGWPDLLVTGYGKVVLFRNESSASGGRQFTEVKEQFAPVDHSWSTSSGWGDIDGDGYPDLYICHYVDWSFTNHPMCKGNSLNVKRDNCGPEAFKPLIHSLFHNEKGKGFRDHSAEQGFRPLGCGLGVILVDLNDDGMPDVYVANDTNYNFLFMNRHGKLEEKALEAGVAGNEVGRPDGSMGVDAGDYDGTGRPSLWVTNFQSQLHALYQNQRKELFHHQSRAAGVAAIGQQFVGFGTGFIDFDNDGWEDLIIANGHVWRFPSFGPPSQRLVLLQNQEHQGRRIFRDVSKEGGAAFQTPALGRGMAIGDLDNDGWPDVVVSNTNSPVVLLKNEMGKTVTNQWVGIKLSGRDYRDVVGSTVILECAGRRLTHFVKGGGGYLSANDQRILFGVGTSEPHISVSVKWAWGKSQKWTGLRAGSYWELIEGHAPPVMIAGERGTSVPRGP